MMSTTWFYTKDHPQANGRTPLAGEQAYTLTFPLSDTAEIKVCCGAETFARFGEMIGSMVLDDEAAKPTLGETLRKISDDALASGMKELTNDEINERKAQARGAKPTEPLEGK